MAKLGLIFASSTFLVLSACGGAKEVAPCAVSPATTASPAPQSPVAVAADATPAPSPATPLPEDAPVAAPGGEYGVEKIKSLAVGHKIREGNFFLVVLPRTTEVDIALTFPSWEEKRFTREERVAKAKEISQVHAGKVMAVLDVVFAGDLMSEGETEKRIPDDIAEYVFLENDRGDAVRCTHATLPIFRSATAMTREVKVDLEFSDLRAKNGRNILDGARELRFVVGGLGFKNKTIRYAAPLHALFTDAPRELKDLFAAAN